MIVISLLPSSRSVALSLSCGWGLFVLLINDIIFLDKLIPEFSLTELMILGKIQLGERLRQLRQEHGLAICKVAAGAGGLDQSVLSKIERGKMLPTISQTKQLADFFSVPFNELDALRIEEDIRRKYGNNPAAALAISRLAEDAAVYGSSGKRKGK